jgi:two-component system sensor histidine kinase BaeS
VAVRYAVTADALEASVADTGPGIDPDDLPHLFTAFWRRDRRDPSGAGLGLWIARAIAEAHGGTLRVASRPGHGTTFHLAIPLAAPAARRWED